MFNRIKEKVEEFFKDEQEEALANNWNKALIDYSKELSKVKEKYKKKEEEYWSMTEAELLKEIAINTLHIRRHFELND